MSGVINLVDCDDNCADQVGGKAIGLGNLLRQGLPVPAGFVVTTQAYRDATAAAGLEARIDALLTQTVSLDDASRQVRALFGTSLVTDELREEIATAYKSLGDGGDEPWVAVRSSATAEDLADASFAGQQDTYLWVRGVDSVVDHLVSCWASLFTPHAIGYRERVGVPTAGLAMGVVIQVMVSARSSGVMMTLEPVTGNRSQMYLEATYGLGEGVVNGDVDCDRLWVSKGGLDVVRQEINRKRQAHRFAPEGGTQLVDVPAELQALPVLRHGDLTALARLGLKIEEAFGRPMDIEWAIADDADEGQVSLLQARPETVWSQRGDVESSIEALDDVSPDDEWDNLHSPSIPGRHWSTDNLGEAAPGVLTPLTVSFHGPMSESCPRRGWYQLGLIPRRDVPVPHSLRDRVVKPFYGRLAIEVEFMASFGNRMPGLSGKDVVQGILGRAPETIDYTPVKRRYPIIAVRLPFKFFRAPSKVRAVARSTDQWWRRETSEIPDRDLRGAQAVLRSSSEHFMEAMTAHNVMLMAVITPLFGALAKAVGRTGIGDVSTLSGHGGAEMAVVSDIWRASRGELSVQDVLASHGFEGPLEGELSSRVWREEPAAIERMVEEYASRPDSTNPFAQLAKHEAEATSMRRELLAKEKPLRRPLTWLQLRMGARNIPLRGVGKRAYVQSLDVARAAARRIGELSVHSGTLDEVDDAFYLTFEELAGELPRNAKELVARRRARRALYQRYDLPSHFVGNPTPFPADFVDTEGRAAGVVTGVGVSAGIVEGTVRVVTSPDFAEVERDEILVAPTTDPSWSSIMFISAALVVDIGGALSHAAVVARELGLPCVVNTKTGTRALRTGDRVRVDGAAGTVHILHQASEPAATEQAAT